MYIQVVTFSCGCTAVRRRATWVLQKACSRQIKCHTGRFRTRFGEVKSNVVLLVLSLSAVWSVRLRVLKL